MGILSTAFETIFGEGEAPPPPDPAEIPPEEQEDDDEGDEGPLPPAEEAHKKLPTMLLRRGFEQP